MEVHSSVLGCQKFNNNYPLKGRRRYSNLAPLACDTVSFGSSKNNSLEGNKLGKKSKHSFTTPVLGNNERENSLLTKEDRDFYNETINNFNNTYETSKISVKSGLPQKELTIYKGSQEGFGDGYYGLTDDKRLVYIEYGDAKKDLADNILASRLYNLAGIKTPKTNVVETEKGFAGVSDVFVNRKGYETTKKSVIDSFVVDAWLGNNKTVNIANNIIGESESQSVKNIVEGTLRYNCHGERKAYSNHVNLIGHMLKNDDSDYIKHINDMNRADLIKSIKKVTDIPNRKIIKTIMQSNVENREDLAQKIINRKMYLSDMLSNVKKTPQNGLDIKKYIYKMEVKTNPEFRYKILNKDDKDFIKYIKDKKNLSISQAVTFNVIKDKNIRQEIKKISNDKKISSEDLDTIKNITEQSFYKKLSASDKLKMLNVTCQLKREMDVPIIKGASLIFDYNLDNKLPNGKLNTDFISGMKDIYSNSKLKNMDFEYAYKLTTNGKADKEKIDFAKQLEDYGINLTDSKEIMDCSVKNKKLSKAYPIMVDSFMKSKMPPDGINLCLQTTDVNNKFDLNILSDVVELKNVGLKNKDIIRLISYCKRQGDKDDVFFRYDISEFVIDRLHKNPKEKINNLLAAESSLGMFSSDITALTNQWFNVNPKMNVSDIPGVLFGMIDHDKDFDIQSANYINNWIKGGIDPKCIHDLINVTSISNNDKNLSNAVIYKKQKSVRDIASYMIFERHYKPEDIYELLYSMGIQDKTGRYNADFDDGKVKYVSDCMKDDKIDAKTATLINEFTYVPDDNVQEQDKPQQAKEQAKARNIAKRLASNGEDYRTIIMLLSFSKKYTGNEKDGNKYSRLEDPYESGALDFVSECMDKNLKMPDLSSVMRGCSIYANTTEMTPEDINKQEMGMFNFSKNLVKSNNLPLDLVASLVFSTHNITRPDYKGNTYVYGFDDNMKNLINNFVDSGVITKNTSSDIVELLKTIKSNNYNKDVIDITKKVLVHQQNSNNKQANSDEIHFISSIIDLSKNTNFEFDKQKYKDNFNLYKSVSKDGFSVDDISYLSKLSKPDTNIEDLEIKKSAKLGLINKLLYASDDTKKLIEEQLINSTDKDGTTHNGSVKTIMNQLLNNVDISSNAIKTDKSRRGEFMRNFISNKNRDKDTGLNPIETKLATFDFTQYTNGVPLKYPASKFISDVNNSIKELPIKDAVEVLKFHNLDPKDGFNSIPRIKRYKPYKGTIPNAEAKKVFSDASQLIEGLNSGNVDLYKVNSNEQLINKCAMAASIPESQIREILSKNIKSEPELNKKVNAYLKRQGQISEFLKIAYNDEPNGLPTPVFVKLVNNDINRYNAFTPKMKRVSDNIENEYKNFIFNNEVKVQDKQLKNILDGVIKGAPNITLVIGKQQHKVHDYTVDIHTLEVLQKAMNDPEYKTLSDKDRTILKYSVLLHDVGKKFINKDTPDTGHEEMSAQIAANVLNQVKLSDNVKNSIITIVKNHNWFELYNKDNLTADYAASKFRNLNNYKIAKIIAKADLASINPDFEYNALNIQDRTPDEYNKIFNKKALNVDKSLNNIYSKSNLLFNTKILDKSKIPYDNKYNIHVLNLANDDIPKDADLGIYGLKGTTKDSMRMTVHMIDSNNNINGNLESTKIGMENPEQENVWSLSLISLDKKKTYWDRKYGFLTDAPISNIALAYNYNLGTGKEKNIRDFANILSSDMKERTFLKKNFITALRENGIDINQKDYIELSKKLLSKSYLSQITIQPTVDINHKKIPSDVLVKSIQKSTDNLLTDTCHSELVAINPRIQGLVAKRNKMDNVNPEFIKFAQKYNLPILLIGE